MKANKVNDINVEGSFNPILDNVLIKVNDIPDTTAGGLALPDVSKQKPTEGTVIAVGPGKEHPETGFLIEPSVKVGDKVIYGEYDGTELKYNGVNHQVIKDDDILLKYSGDTPSIDTVECVRDNVLLQLPKKEEKSNKGLILTTAESSKDKTPTNGKVVKIGIGKMTGVGVVIPVGVAVGDNVKIGYVRPNEIKMNGREYTVVKSYALLAKY
eukprot:CAMPEP_0182427902 /NCGR_PEP_ID=MMETSP1167-20130531/20659_1 /TAXON_ID=2988 /ORGANISM="Mallomonas Sp, Strain CCMP3275" /LENGTH=211 /DNA_ID=CAMNT_0024610475 /DNA_START=178 /DNA_END=813 /DNA_ORIENTATION=-